MKKYDSICSLLLDYKNLPVPGRIFIEEKKIEEINTAYFITISSAEAKDADFTEDEWGRRLPIFLANEGVISWLTTATFQDILVVKFDNNNYLSTKDVDILVSAINHYMEYDDFED